MKKTVNISKIFISFLIILSLFITGCGKTNKDKIITIPLVTWGGYAALFAANNGAEPNEDSLFYKYGHFKVKLIQMEDSSGHLTGFAKGDYPIIWSTVDMVPLLFDSLSKDPKTSPKVIGIFDYSAGGDGIIVRKGINTCADLKGKKIVTSQYTPSHFFILWFLNENGLSTKDVNMVYVEDAILAKDTFIANKDISACVTWSPFIYDVTDPSKDSYVSGSKLIITSKVDSPAHGLIADVYLARTDFIKENPQLLDAFSKAMIEGYDLFKKNPKKVAGQIANLFGIKGGADEVMGMFNDVVIGGKEENKKLFDKNNKFSAYNIINLSTELYKKEGKLQPNFKLNPDIVIDGSFILKAANQ